MLIRAMNGWKRSVMNSMTVLVNNRLYKSMAGGVSVQAAGKQKALNITDLSLSVGQSQKLKVLNGKKVRWSSSKKSVASVSKKGVVKAKKTGKTTITAKVSG